MNMIYFLLRSLLGFVCVVFLMVQPIFAASAANVVDTLNNFLLGKTSFEDANSALTSWDIREPFNPYIAADGINIARHKTDEYGNTVAHKFLEHYRSIEADTIRKLAKLLGDHIFYQKNYYGLNPFLANPDVFKILKDVDLQSLISPIEYRNQVDSIDSFITMLKQEKQKAYRKFDPSKYEGLHTYGLLAKLEYTADIFKGVGLNDDLWNRLADYEMVRTSIRYNHKSQFDSFGFYAVLNQEPRTDVHRSFLQQAPADLAHRDQANQLWQSLFAKSNQLHSQFAKQFGYSDGEYKVSPAVRALGAVNYSENCGGRFFGTRHKQELITLQANLLSSGGTFGMNFNRTANQEEAQIMIHNLESFARRVMDAEQIINALFSNSVTNPILQEKLDDHQINCVIFALSKLSDFSYKTRKLIYEDIKEPYEADISLPDFARIDDFLRAKHPRMKDKDINSKMRYSHLHNLAGIHLLYDPD